MLSIYLFFNLFDTDFSRWRRKIQGILKQSTSDNRNPSNCETFLSLCYWKLFLNNRLMSNTLLTEIDKSSKYFPLTSYYTLGSKFNRTCKNSPVNSIVLQRDGSRNELSFDNFSPSSTSHFFISFTFEKRFINGWNRRIVLEGQMGYKKYRSIQ